MTRQAKAALNNTNDDTENFDDEELEEKNHIEQTKLDRRVFSSRNATISSKTMKANMNMQVFACTCQQKHTNNTCYGGFHKAWLDRL